jgi:copper(I)-binding protein
VATVLWVLGEGFGGLFSGQATDPNSGPLLVLLSLALLGTAPVTAPADELDRVPAWWLSARTSAMSGITALAVVGVALLQWGTSQPAPPPPKPALAVSAAYTPVGDTAEAPVYFTVTNTGVGSDTLTAAGTEFQTKSMASGIEVCSDVVCSGHTVTIPAHGKVTFGPAGPHLLVSGLGALTKAHQPLQVTLTFASSGVVHVLSPVGTPADLTENDVMTYAYMGHKDPGMDMGGMDMGSSPGTSSTPMPGMPGMTMPGG